MKKDFWAELGLFYHSQGRQLDTVLYILVFYHGVFTGTLPYHFLVGILLNEQLCQIDFNPYIFKPHGLKSFAISKNGVSIPQEPIPVGTSDGSFLRSFTHFVENTRGQIFSKC